MLYLAEEPAVAELVDALPPTAMLDPATGALRAPAWHWQLLPLAVTLVIEIVLGTAALLVW